MKREKIGEQRKVKMKRKKRRGVRRLEIGRVWEGRERRGGKGSVRGKGGEEKEGVESVETLTF